MKRGRVKLGAVLTCLDRLALGWVRAVRLAIWYTARVTSPPVPTALQFFACARVQVGSPIGAPIVADVERLEAAIGATASVLSFESVPRHSSEPHHVCITVDCVAAHRLPINASRSASFERCGYGAIFKRHSATPFCLAVADDGGPPFATSAVLDNCTSSRARDVGSLPLKILDRFHWIRSDKKGAGVRLVQILQ